MWKHEIIEGLSAYCAPQDEQAYAELRGLLNNAETFFFGNVEEIVDLLEEQSGKETPLLIDVPYTLTLVEWQDNRKITGPNTPLEAPKRAVLIHSQPLLGLQTYYNFYYATMDLVDYKTGKYKQITEWFVSPIACQCDAEYPWAMDWTDSGFAKELGEEVLDALILDAGRDFTVARVFLDLLNSKQTNLKRDVPAPEKLNAKRARIGRCPLSSYKVLEVVKNIEQPKKVDRQQPQEEERPYAIERIYKGVREHTVRAHSKTFTKERPLLGKYVGTFKWKEQKRGNKKLGTIEKDYSVTIDKSRTDDGEKQ